MGLLANKVALVAGIGPGLGIETAKAFAKQGAAVVLMARREEALREACDMLQAEGGRAAIFVGDVTDPIACDGAVAHAEAMFGGIDIVVANAFYQGMYAKPTESSAEDWRRVLETNLIGPLNLAKAAAPYMAVRGGGSIIMVGSNQVWEVVPGFSAYAASKAGLINLVRHLAVELGVQGIRVNSVHPGLIMGDAARGFISSLAQQQGVEEDVAYRQFASRAALNHVANPEEIAGALVFFASDLACVVSGQSLVVDAGLVKQ